MGEALDGLELLQQCRDELVPIREVSDSVPKDQNLVLDVDKLLGVAEDVCRHRGVDEKRTRRRRRPKVPAIHDDPLDYW